MGYLHREKTEELKKHRGGIDNLDDAVLAFQIGLPVYLEYDDGSEALAVSEQEIIQFYDEFGLTCSL
ncbi:MAG: hypothetical protein AAGF06_06175 [Pseudomonadota bacterium]